VTAIAKATVRSVEDLLNYPERKVASPPPPPFSALGAGRVPPRRLYRAGSPDGEGEDGVDGGFEGAGVALDLGEEEAALERGSSVTASSSGLTPAGRRPADWRDRSPSPRRCQPARSRPRCRQPRSGGACPAHWRAGGSLQKQLNEHHAKPRLVVDGVYGPDTCQAVKYYQREDGLPVDGIAGTATVHSLESQPPSLCWLPYFYGSFTEFGYMSAPKKWI
jgi:hypothetical protein